MLDLISNKEKELRVKSLRLKSLQTYDFMGKKVTKCKSGNEF